MSAADTPKPPTARLKGAAPIFCVRSLEVSIDYYVNVLGFKIEWNYSGTIASVSRDNCAIFLCEGGQGNPGAWVWISADDVELLVAEYRRKGAKVRHPPTNYSWAYEMQIEDLDGNVLRFGSEPKADQPFGEWLDMHGNRWVTSPDGGWARVE